MKRRTTALGGLAATSLSLVLACGESRRPIGEECLRAEDCLSSVCAARSCVSAPELAFGEAETPGEQEPSIPQFVDASSAALDASDARSDAP